MYWFECFMDRIRNWSSSSFFECDRELPGEMGPCFERGTHAVTSSSGVSAGLVKPADLLRGIRNSCGFRNCLFMPSSFLGLVGRRRQTWRARRRSTGSNSCRRGLTLVSKLESALIPDAPPWCLPYPLFHYASMISEVRLTRCAWLASVSINEIWPSFAACRCRKTAPPPPVLLCAAGVANLIGGRP